MAFLLGGAGEEDADARSSGDTPLLEARSKQDEWMKKALASPCSRSLDELLVGKEQEEVDMFKTQIFEQIYNKVGKDPKLASDLQAALMVKNTKFAPWQVVILAVLSCGLFYLVRPADDDALLVLTRQGRVITLKMEREGFFTGSAITVIMTFMKYLMMLVFALSVPSIIVWVFLSGKAASDELGISKALQLQIDEEMLRKVRRHYIIAAETFVAFLFVFLIWLWSKCPHDYGSRFRESYMAPSVSAGQFTMTGRKGFRKIAMRIYFGKYPTQEMLDLHGAVAAGHGHVVATVPVGSLAATGGTGNGSKDASQLKRPSTTSQSTLLIVVLSVVTMMDTALTWMGRAMAASEMVKVGNFCRDAPGPEEPGAEGYCSHSVCGAWAKEHGHPKTFCETVRWHDKVEDKSQIATCAYYGYSSPPCCGGCGIGEAMSFAEEGGWLAAFQEVLGIMADVGTLLFSFMAASAMVSQQTATDHFDVNIKQVRWGAGMEMTSNFDYTMPTAAHFFDTVFDTATTGLDGDDQDEAAAADRGHFQEVRRHQKSTAGSSPSSTAWGSLFGGAASEAQDPAAVDLEGVDDGTQGENAGVSNFVKDKTSKDWEEFFENSTLATRVDGDWFSYKVNVPMHCLGITDVEDDPTKRRAERVVAAWSERPRMMWSSLVVPICTAVALMFILIVCPKSISKDPIILPGLPPSVLGSVVSALVMGVVIIASGVLYQYGQSALNGLEHACIVTDQRIFYIRYQPPCCLLLNFGVNLRVESFRHDRNVTYANVTSNHRSLWQRFTGAQWLPGIVLLQGKFGVLELTRKNGNVFNVFNVVAQLAPENVATFLKKGADDADTAWDWDSTANEAEARMDKLTFGSGPHHGGVRMIRKQPTDLVEHGPALYLITKSEDGEIKELETPIYHWSFKQVGGLSSPFDSTTDVVVTTGRVFLWNRSNYKRFDCKTSLCWGLCWCGWLSAMDEATTRTNSVSFFTLPSLLSFSTTTKVEPPVWTDPTHTPVKFPLYDTLCSGLTKFITCNWGNDSVDLEDFTTSGGGFSILPTRTSPRIELWMLFRLKTSAQQADLMASIKPFNHKDYEDVDFMAGLGCSGEQQKMERQEPEHSRKINQLRAIMGVAQDLAG